MITVIDKAIDDSRNSEPVNNGPSGLQRGSQLLSNSCGKMCTIAFAVAIVVLGALVSLTISSLGETTQHFQRPLYEGTNLYPANLTTSQNYTYDPCLQVVRFHEEFSQRFSTNIDSEIAILPTLETCLRTSVNNLDMTLEFKGKKIDLAELKPYVSRHLNSPYKIISNEVSGEKEQSYRPDFNVYEIMSSKEESEYLKFVNNEAKESDQTPVLYLDGFSTVYEMTHRAGIYYESQESKWMREREGYKESTFKAKELTVVPVANSNIIRVNTLRDVGIPAHYNRVYSGLGIQRAITEASKTKDINHVVIGSHGSIGVMGLPIEINFLNYLREGDVNSILPYNCFENLSSKRRNYIFLISCFAADVFSEINGFVSIQKQFVERLESAGKKGCVFAQSGRLWTAAKEQGDRKAFFPFEHSSRNNNVNEFPTELEATRKYQYLIPSIMNWVNRKESQMDWADFTRLKLFVGNKSSDGRVEAVELEKLCTEDI